MGWLETLLVPLTRRINQIDRYKADKSAVPTKLADLETDERHQTISKSDRTKWNAKSDFSGSYNDLSNKPTLFSGSYDDLSDKPTLFSGSYDDLSDKPTLFSGSYNDLSDKPNIPQGDWNENDETSLSYIKGRTHYYSEELLIIAECSYTTIQTVASTYYEQTRGLEVLDASNFGDEYAYRLEWFDEDTIAGFINTSSYKYYELQPGYIYKIHIIGNESLLKNFTSSYASTYVTHSDWCDYTDTGEDFAIVIEGRYSGYDGSPTSSGGQILWLSKVDSDIGFGGNDRTSSTLSGLRLYRVESVVIPLPEQFIPSTIARTADVLPLTGGTLTDDLNIGSTDSTDDAQLRIAKQGSDSKGYQMGSYISGGNMARTDYIADGSIANFMQLGPTETGFGKPVRVSSGGTGVTSYDELKSALDVIPTPSTASVGQTIVVKSVDENGKPTEWEAVDMASSSGLPEGATAHQQLVTDADGVAKWEDKPFGELLATELVLANTPATWKSWSYDSHYYNIPLVESETSFDTSAEYMVIVNGARYNAVPKYDTRLDIDGVLPDVLTVDGAVGHGMFIYNYGNVCLKNIAEDNPVNLEIAIFKLSVTVKTIAPKFLPENVGGVLVGSVSSDGLSGISFADIYSSIDERKPAILVGNGTYEGLTFYSNAFSDNASSGCTFHAIKIYDGMVQIHELRVLPDGTVSKTLYKLTPTT